MSLTKWGRARSIGSGQAVFVSIINCFGYKKYVSIIKRRPLGYVRVAQSFSLKKILQKSNALMIFAKKNHE
jgi:hypothetical protein